MALNGLLCVYEPTHSPTDDMQCTLLLLQTLNIGDLSEAYLLSHLDQMVLKLWSHTTNQTSHIAIRLPRLIRAALITYHNYQRMQ